VATKKLSAEEKAALFNWAMTNMSSDSEASPDFVVQPTVPASKPRKPKATQAPEAPKPTTAPATPPATPATPASFSPEPDSFKTKKMVYFSADDLSGEAWCGVIEVKKYHNEFNDFSYKITNFTAPILGMRGPGYWQEGGNQLYGDPHNITTVGEPIKGYLSEWNTHDSIKKAQEAFVRKYNQCKKEYKEKYGKEKNELSPPSRPW
jgi:hypothetical protein